jgi:hypothetical protein
VFAEVGLGDRQSLATEWRRIGPAAGKQIDLYLRDLIPGALNALRQLVESKETPPATRLAAVKDILDRVGFVPPKRPELSVQMDNIGQYKKRNWWMAASTAIMI